MSKNTVLELVKQIQAGKEEALSELCIACYQDIYKMAFKFCKNKADANDIVQETLLEITRSIYNLHNPDFFYVWTHRIVKNKCFRMFSKIKYTTMEEEQLRSLSAMKENKVDFLPKEYHENKEDEELMHKFVKALPDHYRIVVELVYFEQCSMDEVQHYLNIPLGTVKSRLFAAKKKLKKMIKTYESIEGRKLHFYDLGSASIFSMFSWKALKQVVQEQIASASIQQVVTYSVIAISCTTTTILSIDAGQQIIEEQIPQVVQTQKAQDNQKKDFQTSEPKEDLPVSSFHVTYQGKTIDTEKDAYFILIDYMNSTIEKNETEKQEVKEIYTALKQENGIYWNLIQQQDYEL